MSQVKNAVLRALIEGVLTELMVKTNVYNVYVDDTTTLAAKLAEVISSLNTKVTTTDMNEAISAAVSGLSEEAKAEVRAYVEETILGGAW